MDARNLFDNRRWSIISLLFAASLINYLDRAALSFALPVISRDFQLTAQSKGLLLSSFFWSYALMQIPIGWAADRFNLRWLYAGAFIVWSCAQGFTGLARSFTALLAFRMLLGIGESIYLPGGTKIVSLLFSPKERGLPSGLFDFGTRTGLVLEGLLVPWLLVHVGWRRTFLTLGFTALLWVAPWFRVFPRRLPAAKPNTATSDASSSAARTLLNRNLIGICLGFFCFDYYWYVLVTWLPDYLVTVRQLNIVQAGFYASLAFFTFGIAEPLGGWIADSLIRHGWNETATRKGIVTVAFSMGDLSHSGDAQRPYRCSDRVIDRSFSRRDCNRESSGDSSVVRASGSSGGLDWGGKFRRKPRRYRSAARGRILDYIPGLVCSRLSTRLDHSFSRCTRLLVRCRGAEDTQLLGPMVQRWGATLT